MNDYDHDVIGVGNPEHPANREETEMFESDNIQECLDYAKEFNDYEPIENAIVKQETIIEKVIDELKFLMDATNSDNVWMRNKLYAIKSKLKSTQVKNYDI
jgi:hypothetical protein